MGEGRERYLEETVRAWLGVRSDAGVELPSLPASLARRLLREEEYERVHRDQWGCWEYGFSENFREGTLLVPEVDLWAAAERRRLAEAGVPLVPLWPDGNQFAVCLTHDVDLVGLASTPAQVLRSMRFSLERPPAMSLTARALRLARPPVRLGRAALSGIALSPDTGVALERSVAIEQEYGVVASYFFTVAPRRCASRYDCLYDLDDPCVFRGRRCRVADVIRQLADDGFDVGLHGSYHSALEPGLLAEQRSALEQAVGVEITTTRQHFLHWDVRTRLVCRARPASAPTALAAGQSALASLAGLAVRAGAVRPEDPTDDDAALVDPGAVGSEWTISGSDSWQWFAASGFITARIRRLARARRPAGRGTAAAPARLASAARQRSRVPRAPRRIETPRTGALGLDRARPALGGHRRRRVARTCLPNPGARSGSAADDLHPLRQCVRACPEPVLLRHLLTEHTNGPRR